MQWTQEDDVVIQKHALCVLNIIVCGMYLHITTQCSYMSNKLIKFTVGLILHICSIVLSV